MAYWRKANAIHSWFVQNVQENKDECQESYVSKEQLKELKGLCEEVLKTKDPTKLPTQEGFLFGSQEVDEYYFQNLRETVITLRDLDENGEYYYRASW